jgi:hypothetical protein
MGRQVALPIVAVPTVAADLTTTDSWLFQISITNSTALPINITILDKQGTPRGAMRASAIPANTTVAFNWEEGLFMSGGVNWVAAGAGLEAGLTLWFKGLA